MGQQFKHPNSRRIKHNEVPLLKSRTDFGGNVDVILNGTGIDDAPKKVGFDSREYEDLWLPDATA